jgi:hypothetical protein
MLFQGAKVRGEDEREKWKLRTFLPLNAGRRYELSLMLKKLIYQVIFRKLFEFL